MRRKPTPVKAIVEVIVKAAGQPVRVRDVCDAVVADWIGPIDKASVRKTLHDGSRGQHPRFKRIGWGLYEAARP